MRTFNSKGQWLLIILTILAVQLFSACKKDKEAAPDAKEATMENIEIGIGNNEQGVIGRDFHLEMDVVAATRINTVQVSIKQRASETYAKKWNFDITWEEFKGAKNTNVHKHFDIDKEAPEGTYDFIIRVNDENGSVKEETRSVKLIKPENLPINPEVYSLMVEKVDKGFVYILNVGYPDPSDKGFKKGETLRSYSDISNVKGDGKIYTVLIKKSAGHLPESVKDIDFSKVIVVGVREHKNMTKVDYFTDYLPLEGHSDHSAPELLIGAAADNNSPAPGAIQGDKAWTNGAYYLGVIYTNTTYNMSVFSYADLTLTGF
jgi:hypothetical protein